MARADVARTGGAAFGATFPALDDDEPMADRAEQLPESQRRPAADVSRPIGLKLWAAVTLVVAVASSLLYVELGAREHRRMVEAKVKASEMVADLLAASLAAPVDFEDQDAIKAELGHAKANPEIVWAGAYAEGSGKLLSAEGAIAAPGTGATGTVVTSDAVTVRRPIVGHDKKPLGTSVLVLTLAPENAAFEDARLGILKLCLLLALGTTTALFLFTRTQIVAPLRRLAAAARDLERGREGVRVDIRTRDELGALAQAFNRMSAAVVDREARLAEARREVVELLDNMRQAIVVFGGEGALVGARSRAAESVFEGRATEGARVADVLYPTLEGWQVERRAFEEWLALFSVAPEALRGELVALAPPEVAIPTADGRERLLELEWRALDGEAARVMLLATDVTEKRALEASRDQQGREVAALRRFVGGGHMVASFLEGAETRVARIRALVVDGRATDAAIESAFQLIHTLRGEAHAFELADVVHAAAEVEELFASARSDGPETLSKRKVGLGLDRVAAGLLAARERFIALAPGGRAALASVPVPRDELARLRALVAGRKDDVARAVDRLTSRPFGELVSTIAERVPAWAASRGKRARVELAGGDVLVPVELANVLPAVLLHLVRNAVAHGIEAPATRALAGKDEEGVIAVRCVSVEGPNPHIVVEDDGGGIVGSFEEIFRGGFTTEAEPSELAGRGVGMGAVRQALAEIGCELKVASVAGKGASFEVSRAAPAARSV